VRPAVAIRSASTIKGKETLQAQGAAHILRDQGLGLVKSLKSVDGS
jgi:hypothetical protein